MGGRTRDAGFTLADPRGRLRRRDVVGAACTAAAGLLAGCSWPATRDALLTAVGRATHIAVGMPAGTPFTGSLLATQAFLRGALQAAAAGLKRSYALSYSGDIQPETWFPHKDTLGLFSFGNGPPAVTLVDDEAIGMPDVVIVPHAWIEGGLAVRALDLTPYVDLYQDAVTASGVLLRCGQAYARGRGMIQAGLPVLRQPMVCAVPSATKGMAGDRPWTLEQFADALTGLAAGGTGAPLAFVPLAGGGPFLAQGLPDDSGLEAAAALGYGARLAEATATGCTGMFASGPALEALTALCGLTALVPAYRSACGAFPAPPTGFPVFAGNLSRAVGGAPVQPALGQTGTLDAVLDGRPTPHFTFGNGGGWVLAPLPVFPARPAVPVQNLDVMVALHTKDPEAAAALAFALLGADAQATLAPATVGLAVRPDVAVGQLQRNWTGAAAARWIANAAYDVTERDALGPQTDANTPAYGRVRSNLNAATLALTGPSGGFLTCFAGDGPWVPPGTAPAACARVLAAAAAAGAAGRAYAPPGINRVSAGLMAPG